MSEEEERRNIVAAIMKIQEATMHYQEVSSQFELHLILIQ